MKRLIKNIRRTKNMFPSPAPWMRNNSGQPPIKAAELLCSQLQTAIRKQRPHIWA